MNRILHLAHPAREWDDASPVGNGSLGAMLFGGKDVEKIYLSEETSWSGGEIDALGGAEEIEITVRGKDQQQDDAEDHTKYTHKRPPFLSFLNIPSRAGGVN